MIKCSVSVVQIETGDPWRLMLTYDDGDCYLSAASWPTQAEAKAASEKWAIENMVAGDDTVKQ